MMLGTPLVRHQEEDGKVCTEDAAGHALKGRRVPSLNSAVCDRAALRAQNKTDTRTRETAVTTVTTVRPRTVTPVCHTRTCTSTCTVTHE